MSIWNDFSSADDQQTFDVIPKGTITRVRMTIKPGGYDDVREGWTGGYATRNVTSGAVYLNAEFVVLEGPYARRKVWSMIGLFSAKGPEYANQAHKKGRRQAFRRPLALAGDSVKTDTSRPWRTCGQ